MIQIYALYKYNSNYNKGFYALIEPFKIESISIVDNSYNKDHQMWSIHVNLPHYNYDLMDEKTKKYYWNSYDDAIEYLKKIGLYNI